jgi:hypothetical protein
MVPDGHSPTATNLEGRATAAPHPAQIAGYSVRQPSAIAQDDHRHSADRNGNKTAPLRGGLRREAGPEQVGVALHAGKIAQDPSHGPGLILEVLPELAHISGSAADTTR